MQEVAPCSPIMSVIGPRETHDYRNYNLLLFYSWARYSNTEVEAKVEASGRKLGTKFQPMAFSNKPHMSYEPIYAERTSASVRACSAELLAGVSAGDFTKILQVLTKDQSALLFHQQRMVEGVGCRACPPAMARRPHWEGWEGMV